ncbi:MAG TPA: methyltransferase [Nocardioides sp.]|uniref:methyltransferase n=1 Tax=Nocardioides sp. TaxID=35761 RepID=UPI002E30838A|nr:methyltransferase [Nocardioides sp.]HEX5088906.1 methyltransferase [Nocardioides sp.]
MTAVAQRELSPVPLMQLATAFWAFKTLAAAHELDLFPRLSGTPGVTSLELAEAWGIEERPADMLLTGCSALGLLEKREGRYVNSPLAEEFLVRGRPYYFGGFVQMLDQRLYPGWGRLTEAIRTNRPTTWDPVVQDSLFDGEDPELLAVFWEAMHSLSTFTARELGRAIDLSDARRLLDVGGGSAAYDIELCRLHPDLTATVYDLPKVVDIAAGKVREAGLDGRIETVAGDFFADASLPGGHDTVLLSMILHDWAEERGRAILQKCWTALPSGGRLVIAELLVDDERTGPPAAALMSLNMLVETEGRNYTPAEYEAWLAELGFVDVHTVWFEAPGANGAVIGRKP